MARSGTEGSLDLSYHFDRAQQGSGPRCGRHSCLSAQFWDHQRITAPYRRGVRFALALSALTYLPFGRGHPDVVGGTGAQTPLGGRDHPYLGP